MKPETISPSSSVATTKYVAKMERLGTANAQWANRPDDERYLSLDDLRAAVESRRLRSVETGGIALEHYDVTAAGAELTLYPKAGGPAAGAELTHASFGQLCQRAAVPAQYLRKLPTDLAAVNLSWSLGQAESQDAKLLLTRDEADAARVELRCLTSPSYGRIWDADVVAAVQRNCGDEWKIPAASYATENPKRATTLYASDRDVFIFLVDDSHPIEVPGEPGHNMFRGFYVSNSETMHGSFVLASFLYDRVCDNRNIWGVREFHELRIRHTAAAPERFLRDAKPTLTKYLESGAQSTVDMIRRSQDTKLADSVKDLRVKLAALKFTKSQVQGAIDYAEARPGNPLSLWNIQQGLTAVARDVPNTDDRMDLEARAGKLMLAVE